jgi:hypothetical protein
VYFGYFVVHLPSASICVISGKNSEFRFAFLKLHAKWLQFFCLKIFLSKIPSVLVLATPGQNLVAIIGDLTIANLMKRGYAEPDENCYLENRGCLGCR